MVVPRTPRIAQVIIASFDMTAPPRTLTEVIADLSLLEGWHPTAAEAQEYGERIEGSVRRRLIMHLDRRNAQGQACRYDFNSSSEYLIQGACFVAPNDSFELGAAKLRRMQASDYLAALRTLQPREFESACRGVLVTMGADDATLTRSANDQGIDFFGRLSLKGRLAQQYHLPSFDTTLSVWLVGQAKHYQATQVATPDIRELVGSVELARARVYADSGAALAGLNIRRCDPVFYLFLTTGTISSDGWTLLHRSGVLAMDGETLASFMADSGIAVDENGALDVSKFAQWLQDHAG